MFFQLFPKHMLALFLLGAVSATITSYYDDIQDFRCYSLKNSNTTNGLSCVFPVSQAGQCFFFCGDSKTSIRTERAGSLKINTALEDQPACSINFNGSCTLSLIAGGPPFLCTRHVEKPATFPEAVADCKRSNDGDVFVPDTDADLENLMKRLSPNIGSIWLGGGTLFHRSCGRDVHKGVESEEMATVFTREQRGNTFGYASTRLAEEKHSYACIFKCPRLSSSF